MELKPGYKQTEVGVIPEDWDTQTLGSVAIVERGKFSARPRNDPKFFGGGVPFIQTGDVTNSDGRIKSFSQTLNSQGLAVSKSFPINTLFFTIAANIGDVGICSFATACPDSLVAITPKAKIDKEWIFHYLRRQKKKFESLATHNAQLNINLEKLNPFVLSVPSLPEQRAIAVALSDTDALLSSLDRLLAKKRDIKQAVMQQLLTGKQRLPGFSEEWEVKRLGDIAAVNMGQSPLSQYYNRQGVGVPLIQGNADIENRRTTQRVWTTQITKQCDENDLILTVRAPVGAVAVASTFSCVGRGVCALKAIGVDKQFLFFVLVFSEVNWKVLEQGSTFTSANFSQVAAFEVSIAPSIKEQAAIATVLSDLDAEIDALQQRRDKTRSIKQCMMQELLTGRTRLV